MTKVLKVPRHPEYRHSTKFPVRSTVKYTTLRIQSPDHNVHEIKMASEDGTGRDVTDTEELTQIVRECVRNDKQNISFEPHFVRTTDVVRTTFRSNQFEPQTFSVEVCLSQDRTKTDCFALLVFIPQFLLLLIELALTLRHLLSCYNHSEVKC